MCGELAGSSGIFVVVVSMRAISRVTHVYVITTTLHETCHFVERSIPTSPSTSTAPHIFGDSGQKCREAVGFASASCCKVPPIGMSNYVLIKQAVLMYPFPAVNPPNIANATRMTDTSSSILCIHTTTAVIYDRRLLTSDHKDDRNEVMRLFYTISPPP